MELPSSSISDLKTTTIKIDSLIARLSENLQQAGLFRALVVESNGNRILLDTAFGQIKGVTQDKLLKGDEVLARLEPDKPGFNIKIEKIQNAQPALPQKIINQLSKLTESLSSNLPVVIKVISHTTDKTVIQLDHKNYKIPLQPLLKAGESLLLKLSSNQKVELLRINPQSILKNALSNLLPRTVNTGNSADFTGVQKLAANFLNLKQGDLPNHQPTVNPAAGKLKVEQGSQNKSEATLPVQPPKQTQQQATTILIRQLLTALSQPLAKVDGFKASSLNQILNLLSLVKSPPATGHNQQAVSIPASLIKIASALSHSPDNLNHLIRQIIDSNSGNNRVSVSESAIHESASSFKNELLQQVEQTLNQLTTQKTAMRLNQELNLPIQLNLNIPLQLNNETTSLKLKIKQRKNDEAESEKHWEISLAFEFAQLGLISTNILLQDVKLSANFWAEKSSTKQLIDTHMTHFKNQLKKSGFEPGHIDCFIGKPIDQEEQIKLGEENLVDIKV